MQFKPRKVKDINNPIQAYIDDSNYAVQEKIDGERLLIIKTHSSIDGFNRRGESVDVPTHIANYFTQHHLPGIYDGEYVVRAKRYFI